MPDLNPRRLSARFDMRSAQAFQGAHSRFIGSYPVLDVLLLLHAAEFAFFCPNEPRITAHKSCKEMRHAV